MITVPTAPVPGQVIRADLLRDIINALRQVRPIGGHGIRIEETLNGVIFSATAQEAEAGTEFDYRFRVTLTKATKTTEKDGVTTSSSVQALKIRKGSLYKIAENVATSQAITVPDKFKDDPTDDDAWLYLPESGDEIAGGSLFLAYGALPTSESTDTTATEATEEGYYLDYGSPDDVALFVIADVKNSSSTNGPVITQRVLGDLYVVEAGTSEASTTSWTVRAFTEEGTDGTPATTWKVYRPIWVTQSAVYDLSNGGDWCTLPFTPTAGTTLYAVLQLNVDPITFGLASAYLQMTNDISGMEDTPAETPTRYNESGTPGIYYYKAEIGAFSTDEETGELVFNQAHVGTIVEDWLPIRTLQEVTLPTGFEVTTEGKLKVTTNTFLLPSAATSDPQTYELDLPVLPDGTLLPGAVEYQVAETSDTSQSSSGTSISAKFVQKYLKWDLASKSFAASDDDTIEITPLTSHLADHGDSSSSS